MPGFVGLRMCWPSLTFTEDGWFPIREQRWIILNARSIRSSWYPLQSSFVLNPIVLRLLDGGRNLCDVGKTERQNRLMRLPMSYMLPAAGSCILQAPCVPGKCGGGKRERGKGREGVASGRPCRARRQGLLPCRRAADPPQQAVSGIEAPNDSLMHDTTIPHGSLLF